MDPFYLKVLFMMSSSLFTSVAPAAMLQHATSSQSFVLHQPLTSPQSAPPSSRDNIGASSPAKYEYKYEVSDHETGDRKSHWESRDGDTVRGAYSLYEPDGSLRTVEYTADAVRGFNAVVRRDEPTKHQNRRIDSPLTLGSNGFPNPVSDRYSAPAPLRYVQDRAGPSAAHGREPKYLATNAKAGIGFTVNHDSPRQLDDHFNSF